MQRRLIIVFLLMTTTGIHLFAQRKEDVLAYISAYKDLAISEMKRTGVPAAITLAQGIHETEAGNSELVRKSNNHFGIKCKSSWTGDKVYHDDDALGECFRSYGKPEDSYMDHSEFLKKNQRYAFLFTFDPTDYESWAYGLKKAGYATNIRYSQVLIRIIEEYNLQDYTLIALGRLKESDQVVAAATGNAPNGPSSSVVLPTSEHNSASTAAPAYPSGEFTINNTKVIYVNAHTSWLSIAEKYNIPVVQLWDFNDLENDDDVLLKGQLVFLQRKRKVGAAAFHLVKDQEDLYDICQAYGVRLESLLAYNHLNGDMKPAPGEKLYLQYPATARPLLIGEKNRKALFGNADAAKPVPVLGQNTNGNNSNFFASNPATPGNAARTLHQVASKETLYSISRKYGVDVEKIREWNRLDSLHLRTGQALVIYTSN